MISGGSLLPDDWFPRPLPPNIILGEHTWLYSAYAFLHYACRRPCGLKVGRNTGLYNGTMFDLGPNGEVEIGDFCTLVGAIFSTNGRVRIGNYVLIAHDVFIADAASAAPPGPGRSSLAFPPQTPPIVIEDDAWVCTRAVLLPGAHIGAGAIVGAAAVVNFAVPAGATVAGNPARIVSRSGPGEGAEA